MPGDATRPSKKNQSKWKERLGVGVTSGLVGVIVVGLAISVFHIGTQEAGILVAVWFGAASFGQYQYDRHVKEGDAGR